jgi:hypothetical protein
MIKKLSALTLIVGCCMLLWGADFWQSKPYTDWDQKEIQTILSNSPWADRMSVETGQRGVIGNDQAKGPIEGNITAQVTLAWRTALPVKQAVAKSNNTPADAAKASFERAETSYVLALSGLPGSARTALADKDKVTAETSIKIKGKPDLKPTEFEIAGGAPVAAAQAANPAATVEDTVPAGGRGGGRGSRNSGPSLPSGNIGGGGGGRSFGNIDLFIAFPRSAGISLDDKEVEFVTKIGPLVIRKKFKLKDMVFNGKLEM